MKMKIIIVIMILSTGCTTSYNQKYNYQSGYMSTNSFCERAGSMTIYELPIRCYEYYNVDIDTITKLNNINIKNIK